MEHPVEELKILCPSSMEYPVKGINNAISIEYGAFYIGATDTISI